MGAANERPLNPRQDRFCQEYLIDLIGSQAAIRAGYSERSAEVQAARLLRDDRVKRRIAELKAERQERTKIDADWLVQRLAMIATADVRSIMRDDGSLLPPSQWPDDVAAAVQGVDVSEIGPASDPMGVVKKVRRADVLKALELLGKHVSIGAFRERVEHSMDEDLASRILGARRRARVEESDG